MKLIEILEKSCSVNIITHWKSVDFHTGIMLRGRIINLRHVLCNTASNQDARVCNHCLSRMGWWWRWECVLRGGT